MCSGRNEGECKSPPFCLLACYVSSVLIEQWRKGYNQERPYNAFGYRRPAPEVKLIAGQLYPILAVARAKSQVYS
jgi:hypothetical protein